MSQNPPENDMADYYSPQKMATRLFQLDLQVENLKQFVRLHADQMNGLTVQLMDLQHQIRQCAARHDEDKNG